MHTRLGTRIVLPALAHLTLFLEESGPAASLPSVFDMALQSVVATYGSRGKVYSGEESVVEARYQASHRNSNHLFKTISFHLLHLLSINKYNSFRFTIYTSKHAVLKHPSPASSKHVRHIRSTSTISRRRRYRSTLHSVQKCYRKSSGMVPVCYAKLQSLHLCCERSLTCLHRHAMLSVPRRMPSV